MRQFIEISGSCSDRMKVTIRQVHEVGGKLIVFADLAKQKLIDRLAQSADLIFRDQVVVDTDATEKLPVTYVLIDVDPEDIGLSVEDYIARYQLRGVNRSGDFEISYIGKIYPLSVKAKLRYQFNPDRTDSFRMKDSVRFTTQEVSPYFSAHSDLKNILNIYSTVQNGVYKIVLEVITTARQFTVMPRSLFPEDVFTGDDFNRIYRPTIEETIYFKATCRGELRQYQTCALSLEVPGDDLTAVVDLIDYLSAAWDQVFYKDRRFDLVQVSKTSVMSCYQDPWFVCARVSEQDKRQYRQILNPPIALDKFLQGALRFDFRDSLRTMISQDIQSLANLPAYELLAQIFLLYADDIEYRRLLNFPCQVLCDQTRLDLGVLRRADTPYNVKIAVVEKLEQFLAKIDNSCSRLLYRYLLNRFNRDYVKTQYCNEIASQEILSEVKPYLEFLKLAVFEMMSDKRMSIALSEHPVFLQKFAGSPDEGAAFFKSFSWVVKMDFDHDSDYQSCLKLTSTSSRFLRACGFHLDEFFWDSPVEKRARKVSYPAANYRLFGKAMLAASGQSSVIKQFDQRIK